MDYGWLPSIQRMRDLDQNKNWQHLLFILIRLIVFFFNPCLGKALGKMQISLQTLQISSKNIYIETLKYDCVREGDNFVSKIVALVHMVAIDRIKNRLKSADVSTATNQRRDQP